MTVKPPVFLVGPARSGSSLLYKALCLHPEAAYFSNYVRRLPALPQLGVLNRAAAALPEPRRRAWFDDGNAYVYGRDRSVWRRLFPMPVEGEPVFARCGIAAVPGGREPGREPDLPLLRRTVDRVLRSSGGTVLVSKRIANSLRIPLLLQAFPDARFVFLVRDGRAVAYSLSRVDWWPDSTVWWYGGTPRDWVAEGRDPWELCAGNWLQEMRETELGLERVPTEQRLDVRYEDFISAPVAALETIAGFAGLCPDGAWRAELSRLSFPDRNEAWRHQLDEKASDRITSIQAPVLQRLGYQP